MEFWLKAIFTVGVAATSQLVIMNIKIIDIKYELKAIKHEILMKKLRERK